MVVPKFKEFYLPTLRFFEDKKIHTKIEVAENVAKYLNLTEEELNEKTRGGGRLRYKDRSGWAVDHLTAATLLNRVSKGKFEISDEGLKVLNENFEDIDENFLMQYDSFKKYKKHHKSKPISGNDDITEIRILPMSNKNSCCSTLDETIDFLSNRIITDNNCRYYFKTKFNFSGNTLVLFQYENGLIAKAIFTDIIEEKFDEYNGYFVLDEDSIVIFNKKITIDELNEYVPINQFSQVKQKIDLKYLGKINEMIENFSSEDPIRFEFKPDETRNLIYFGAPGTGKSYRLNDEMEILLEEYKHNHERVTFHPDYSYANFVGTYKPELDGKDIIYEFVPGPFMRVLKSALDKPNEPHMLIIEEINRANVAAVFGDIFQILDRNSDNKSVYPINTSEDMKKYLKKELGRSYEQIYLPSNLFIWATMNSADQGVFPMDTAFKRRWDFEYFGIDDGANEIDHIKIYNEIPSNWKKFKNNKNSWNEIRIAINNALLEIGINEDKLLGPFFAFNEYIETDGEIDFKEFEKIFSDKILMYLFEDVAKYKRKELFYKENLTFSQVRDEFKEIGFEIFCESIQNYLLDDKNE